MVGQLMSKVAEAVRVLDYFESQTDAAEDTAPESPDVFTFDEVEIDMDFYIQEAAKRYIQEVAAKKEADRLAAEVAAKQAEVAEEALLVFLQQLQRQRNGTAPAAARLQRQLLPTVNSDV